jgi:hypothetical protein
MLITTPRFCFSMCGPKARTIRNGAVILTRSVRSQSSTFMSMTLARG